MKCKIFLSMILMSFFVCQPAWDSTKPVAYPRLLIKMPTRQRPEKFFEVLDLYVNKLSGEVPVQFVISCDEDDASMNCPSVIEQLKTYKNLSYYFSPSLGKVEAVNRDIDKHLDFDVLLVASDDMIPVVHGYDKVIVQKMRETFADFDGTLNFFDGHCGGELNTIPLMGKKYYDRFGYVYFPGYKSVCCDLEFTLVAELLGKNKVCDELIIRHEHPAYGAPTDELYKINESSEYHRHDKEIVQKRKAKNFGLKFEEISTAPLPTSLDLFGKVEPKKVKWSILICTLDSRNEQFAKLYRGLLQQIEVCNLHHEVEVLFFLDDKDCSVGYKRNRLVAQARGEYVSFVDDDDEVSPNYVAMIAQKLQEKPDCVSLVGVISWPGKKDALFVHSIRYNSYFEKDGVYYRPPNHLNPIRTDIACRFKFPEKNFAEDTDWAMQICNSRLLKKEAQINRAYYHYKYNPLQSQTFLWTIFIVGKDNDSRKILIKKLSDQINSPLLCKKIELLVADIHDDNVKRAEQLNEILKSVHGAYVSFIDPSVDISDNYVRAVVNVLEQEKKDWVSWSMMPVEYSVFKVGIARKFSFVPHGEQLKLWAQDIIASQVFKSKLRIDQVS